MVGACERCAIWLVDGDARGCDLLVLAGSVDAEKVASGAGVNDSVGLSLRKRKSRRRRGGGRVSIIRVSS